MIEDIKSRNESNMVVLNSAIEVGVISNMDLLKLYENYNIISDSFVNLWSEYSFYIEIRDVSLEQFKEIKGIAVEIDS